MTALRQAMIEAMRQHGFAQRTQHTYLMVITDLARYFHRPPDTLSPGKMHEKPLYDGLRSALPVGANVVT